MTNQPTRTTTKQSEKASHQQKPKPVSTTPANESGAVQRVLDDPLNASPQDVLAVQKSSGNRAATQLIQTKLTVGAAGDQYEQEADRVAEQVVSAPPSNHPAGAAVQRSEEEEELQAKPLASQITPLVQRHAEEEEEIQAKATSSAAGFQVGDNLEQRIAQSRGGGSPMPAETRAFMEPRFGSDFSSVRVHADGEAAQMNRDLSAQAFTLGQDIYMGAGKYDPGSGDGQRLLAHELTHVVQQTGPQLKEEEEVQRFSLAPEHIQRHGSAEHMLLGQVNPQQLADSAKAKVPVENRLHALHQELRRSRTWHQKGALGVKESDGAPYQVRMVCIGKDKNLWLSYGELNAMPDYLPSSDALENGETDVLSKLIQHVRFESVRWIREQVERIVREERETIKPIRYDMVGEPPAVSAIPIYSEVDQKRLTALRELERQEPGLALTEMGSYDRAQYLAGSISSQSVPAAGAAETLGLDNATGNLGQDKYSNLLGRNACHFAPYSWDRWLQSHTAARATALKAFNEENEATKTQLYNSALIQNGYADHFLQDSFAAGHLINKTLVMQWYVEWMNTKYAEIARSQLAETAGGLGQSAESSSQWGQNTQKSLEKSAASSSQWGQDTQKDWDKSAESSSQWGQNAQQDWDKSAEGWSEWGQQQQQEGTGFWGSIKGLGARAAGGTMWALQKGVGGLARGAGGVAWGAQKGVGGLARGAGGVAWGAQEGVGGLARGAGGVAWGAQKVAQGVVSGASTVAGIPMPSDWDQIKDMTQAQQPGLAGMHLYEGPFRQRKAGESSDPQTAQEQGTAQERMAKSGVKGGWQDYQDYLTFLKKSSLQLASSRLHDLFCKEGLTVSNSKGEGFKVHGDYNLLTTGENVAQGVLIASTAAQLSRQAIEEIAEHGNTKNSAEQIFAHFPQKVTHPGAGEYSLAAWHGGADMPGPLKAYTIAKIFEPMWQTVWNNALPDMDKISQDAGAPPPHEPF
ncbi:hypothetical protein TFLX_03003 [Thermoflexales bacterium]|nr:hypothetical protein TFLX_03003 [Thermoflexales bacterium]